MKKALRIITGIIVTLLLVFAIWHFVLTKYVTLFQSYEGVVLDGYKLQNPQTSTTQDSHTDKRTLDFYYWRVKLDSGEIRDIKLPAEIWQQGGSSAPIIKEIGQRYPHVRIPDQTPEATATPDGTPPVE